MTKWGGRLTLWMTSHKEAFPKNNFLVGGLTPCPLRGRDRTNYPIREVVTIKVRIWLSID